MIQRARHYQCRVVGPASAAGGAILAGPKTTVSAVAHARKLFGAGVFQAWPQAAVALHFSNGFSARYAQAVATMQVFFAELVKNPRFHVEPFPGGTNIIKLTVDGADSKKYRAELKRRGIIVRPPRTDIHKPQEFWLFVNESVNRRPAQELADAFVQALKSA